MSALRFFSFSFSFIVSFDIAYNSIITCFVIFLKHSNSRSFYHNLILGDPPFTHAAPKLWNALPLDSGCKDTVGGFKGKIRTYLLCKLFS